MVTINIEKKHLFIVFGAILLLAVIILVNAYGGNNPSVVGHTIDEIEGLSASGGCDWEGWKCHCNADTGGSTEGYTILGVYCMTGSITDFKLFRVVISASEQACPTSYSECDIYSSY